MRHPLLLLISLGFIWGCGYTLAHFAMHAGVSPLGYSFWQAFGPLCLLQCTKKNKLSWSRSYWILGLLGITLPNSTIYFMAKTMPASTLAVLVNTVPIFTYLLAFGLGRIRFSKQQFIALIMGIFGIYFVLNPRLNYNPILLHWLWILIAPLSFAATALFIEAQCKTEPSLDLTCGMLTSASVLLFPIVIQQQAFHLFSWPITQTDAVILLEIFLSAVGYLIFFELLRTANALYYSFVGGIVAITGLSWGYVLFDESLSWHKIIGTIMIITAINLMTEKQYVA